jgi:hypothetical protein
MFKDDVRTALVLRFRAEGIRAHRYHHSLTIGDASALQQSE